MKTIKRILPVISAATVCAVPLLNYYQFLGLGFYLDVVLEFEQ